MREIKNVGVVLSLLMVLWLLDRLAARALNEYSLYLLRLILINLVLAESLNLVLGFTGQFSLGHAGFMAIGAYASAALSKGVSAHFPELAQGALFREALFVGAVLLGGGAATVVGFVVGLPALRLRGDYLAIATLGFGEIVRVLFVNTEAVGGARGLTGIPALGEARFLSSFFWDLLFGLVTLWVIYRMVRSTKGRAFLCIREDEVASEAMGIPATYYKVLAFAVGAFFAGVAGALYAHDPSQLYINPDTFKFMKSVEVVVMVILGGMGSLTGTALSAGVLTLLPEVLRSIGEYRLVLYAVLLILLMLLRPQGLLGNREISLSLFFRKAPRAEPPAAAEEPVQTTRAEGKPLLQVSHCTMQFGGLTAVSNFNLSVREGELVGLIGPNGAGKTTLFNLMTGVYHPTAGEIFFDGRQVTGWRPFRIAQSGIARTFQSIRLFKSLTVFDNVRSSKVYQSDYSFLDALFANSRYEREEGAIRKEVEKLLQLMGLLDFRDAEAENLPYGSQRRLEIARALALSPRLLLLDEPAAGMNPAETAELTELIRKLNRQWGLTVLLIEHDMRVVMGICERILVLDFGEIIAEGTPQEIRHDPKVIAAYLGEEITLQDARREESEI